MHLDIFSDNDEIHWLFCVFPPVSFLQFPFPIDSIIFLIASLVQLNQLHFCL